MSNEDKTLKFVMCGEFKRALEWWRKSDVCTTACDDCPNDGTQYVGILETYLKLSPHVGIDEVHLCQLREWVDNGMND